MQFALLVSQLPHVDEARAQYNEMLILTPRSHAPARAAAAIWNMLKRLAR